MDIVGETCTSKPAHQELWSLGRILSCQQVKKGALPSPRGGAISRRARYQIGPTRAGCHSRFITSAGRASLLSWPQPKNSQKCRRMAILDVADGIPVGNEVFPSARSEHDRPSLQEHSLDPRYAIATVASAHSTHSRSTADPRCSPGAMAPRHVRLNSPARLCAKNWRGIDRVRAQWWILR